MQNIFIPLLRPESRRFAAEISGQKLAPPAQGWNMKSGFGVARGHAKDEWGQEIQRLHQL